MKFNAVHRKIIHGLQRHGYSETRVLMLLFCSENVSTQEWNDHKQHLQKFLNDLVRAGVITVIPDGKHLGYKIKDS